MNLLDSSFVKYLQLKILLIRILRSKKIKRIKTFLLLCVPRDQCAKDNGTLFSGCFFYAIIFTIFYAATITCRHSIVSGASITLSNIASATLESSSSTCAGGSQCIFIFFIPSYYPALHY
jgi:hypothetical protein